MSSERATITGLSERMFVAEARLRFAAESYAKWLNATNRTTEILNKHRAELRAAAISFAALARQVDG